MQRRGADATKPRIHLAIDAVGLRADSGGATVLADLLRACSADPRFETTIFASARLAASDVVSGVPGLNIEVEAPRHRLELLWWNLRGLSARAERLGATALLSMNSLARSRRLPVFVLFQQQLMFAPEAALRMERGFRLRLPLLARLAGRACREARLVFTQGDHVRRNIISHFGVQPSRVHSIPPDITWPSAATVTPARDPALLVYVGSAQPHKSLGTLFDAFAELRAGSPSLELLTTLARDEQPEQPGIRGVGRLPRAQVRELLARANVLIMPSLAETVGLPLLEALDMGCNVVAADLPYAREVCGDAALYFGPGSAADCAAKVRSLLADPELGERLRLRGRDAIAERRQVAPYARLLREICQNMP